MTRICIGCGEEIPDGQEFCYRCGAWADKAVQLDDSGGIVYSDMCPGCGKAVPSGSEYCPYCGTKVQGSAAVRQTVVRRPWDTRDYLSVAFAVIPGFFNIFGIGQIVQRRWSKAFVYITMTIILYYLKPSFSENTGSSWVLLILQMGLFMFSLIDVFNNAGKRGQ